MGGAPEEEPGRDVSAAFDPGELSFRHQDKLLSSQFSSSLCSLHDITFLLLFRPSLSIMKDIVSRKNIKNAQIDWQKKKKRHYDVCVCMGSLNSNIIPGRQMADSFEYYKDIKQQYFAVHVAHLSKMILMGYPGGASIIHSQLRASL